MSTYIIMYSIIVFTIVHSLYIDKLLGLITCNEKIILMIVYSLKDYIFDKYTRYYFITHKCILGC